MRLSVSTLRQVVKRDWPITFVPQQLTSYGGLELVRRYLSSTTVEQAPPFKAHYLLGTILEKQGDKEGAAREYQTALTLAKDFGRAREALNRVNR